MARNESSAFYLERAEDAARLATATRLAKVRDNLLAAERSWREMAERAASSEDAEDRRRDEAAERRSIRKARVAI